MPSTGIIETPEKEKHNTEVGRRIATLLRRLGSKEKDTCDGAYYRKETSCTHANGKGDVVNLMMLMKTIEPTKLVQKEQKRRPVRPCHRGWGAIR
jgi:hypothetical protein